MYGKEQTCFFLPSFAPQFCRLSHDKIPSRNDTEQRWVLVHNCRGISVPPLRQEKHGSRSSHTHSGSFFLWPHQKEDRQLGRVIQKQTWPAPSDFCQQSPLSEDSKFSHSATSCRPSLQDINIPDSKPITLPKLSSEPQPLCSPQLRWGPGRLGCVDTSDSYIQGWDYLGGNSTNEKLLHLLSQQWLLPVLPPPPTARADKEKINACHPPRPVVSLFLSTGCPTLEVTVSSFLPSTFEG